MSYLDVFGIHLPVFHQPIAIGDTVALGQNPHPQFEVMAISGDRAWVRDIASGSDSIVAAPRCRRIA